MAFEQKEELEVGWTADLIPWLSMHVDPVRCIACVRLWLKQLGQKVGLSSCSYVKSLELALGHPLRCASRSDCHVEAA